MAGSKIKWKWFCEKRDGRLELDDPDGYSRFVESLKPGRYYLVVNRDRGDEGEFTKPQFAYYYGVVLPLIAEATGDDDLEALDEDLKANMASYIDPKTGMLKIIRKRDMTAAEASAYIDKVIRWAAQFLGVYVPPPNCVEWEGM